MVKRFIERFQMWRSSALPSSKTVPRMVVVLRSLFIGQDRHAHH
jgi:hypothetical protein